MALADAPAPRLAQRRFELMVGELRLRHHVVEELPIVDENLRAALDEAKPDILCVQEATPEQVAFLEEALPAHGRVGVGRDGPSGGEHCAIYFNRQRFAAIGGNTFWLEEPIDQPGASSALDAKRICTWVRLRDQANGRTVRVYNAHLYL